MNYNPRILSSLLFVLTSISVYSSTTIASAQITPDNTLGAENSRVNQINQLKSLIEGGAIRGDNLFHSFLEFNINNGNSAYFANPNGINNILGRITGGNVSQILGTLGVNGNANLFLLNPNGFIFGENATLDLNGSFTVTTGNISLGENGVFSLTNIPTGNILNIKPEAVFSNLTGRIENQASLVVRDGQNLVLMANDVVNQGNLLSYGDLSIKGENLQLTGTLAAEGNLNIKALDTVTIRDRNTEPFKAIAGTELLIQGNQVVDIFALNNSDSGIFAGGNLTLRSVNRVIGDAHYWSGGDFRVEKSDGNLGGLESLVDPVIRTVGDVFIKSYIGASLHIIAGGKVEIPGLISITRADTDFGLQETIALSDGQQVLIDGKNNPTLDIRAGVSAEFIGQPFFEGSRQDSFFPPFDFTNNPSTADINLGTVIFRNAEDINQKITGDVLITNQYQPNPNLTGNINFTPTLANIAIDTGSDLSGGRVLVDSRGDINLTGNIIANSNLIGGDVVLNSLGDTSLINGAIIVISGGGGGNININANNLLLDDINNGDANLNAGSSILDAGINSNLGNPQAIAGDITINVTENVTLKNNSSINNIIAKDSLGKSGDISIKAETIEVLSGSFISTLLNGEGDTGNLKLDASSILVDGSARNLVSSIQASSLNGKGNVGDIEIDTKVLTLSNGGQLVSDIIASDGDGSNITINASEKVTVEGEFLAVSADTDIVPVPLSSNISSNLGNLDNSENVENLDSNSFAKAGNIIINTPNFELRKGARIQTSIFGTGEAGNITLNTDNIILTGARSDGFPSFIDSSLQIGTGKGGNIEINTTSLEMTDGTTIQASTFSEGDAGRINIQAENILITGERSTGFGSSISSNVGVDGVGNGGNINIETNQLELFAGGSISSITQGKGNSGSITINADSIAIGGTTSNDSSSQITNQVDQGKGNGNNILINADSLTLSDDGVISSATFAQGNGGVITLNISEIYLSQSRIGAPVETQAKGNGGNIFINSNNLILDDLSFIQANLSGEGKAGNININTKSLSVQQGSQIVVGVFGKGNAGNISIQGTDIVVDGENPENTATSIISSSLSDTGVGNSGSVEIKTTNLTLINGGQITSGIVGKGNAGQIIVQAENITIDGENNTDKVGSAITSSVDKIGQGNGGDIDITTNNLTLSNGGFISVAIRGKGDGGKVTINAENINIDGQSREEEVSAIRSSIAENSQGNGGEIEINTQSLTFTNNASVNASTKGLGNAGSISINASNLRLDDSSISIAIASTAQTTEKGNINIDTQDLNLTNKAFITAQSDGKGDGGEINIISNDIILTEGSFIESNLDEQGIGRAGSIQIDTTKLTLSKGGFISASTSGEGDGGLIEINATDSINISGESFLGERSGIFSTVEETAKGSSEGITINTNDFNLLDGAFISTSTEGKGNAGIIDLEVSNSINISGESSLGERSGIFSTVEETAKGSSDGIIINTTDFTLNKGAFITASTSGQGDAGDIEINATTISISGESSKGQISGIFTEVTDTGVGQSGNIAIAASSVNISDGSIISASTFGEGEAGEINIEARESISISGESSQGERSGIESLVEEGAIGDSQGISIDSATVKLENGARIIASTSGEGKAGTIDINASDSVSLLGQSTEGKSSSIESRVEEQGKGNSEEINVETNTLTIDDGGTISTSTLGDGNAGNIFITANDSVSITGTFVDETLDRNIGGVLAFTLTSGKAGNIDIVTPQFVLQDGAGVEAFTQGRGDAGNITVNAPELVNIGNEGKIIVETSAQGKPGNIEINTNTLNINQDASLSATATATANNEEGGGSITLNTDNLNISGALGIFAETQGDTPAGNITINPDSDNPNLSIQFTDNGFISALTTSVGKGGSIDITAPEIVNIKGQGSITAETSGEGDAGNINIHSGIINITDGVTITTSTASNGSAGEITLNARESLSISNQSQVNSEVTLEAKGDSQGIDIDSPSLTLSDNSQISAATQGEGDAGDIIIDAPQEVIIESNSILNVETNSRAQAGDIEITTNTLTIGDDAQLSARTKAQGEAGSIDLITNQLNIRGELGIFAETQGEGDAGNLAIAPYNSNQLNIIFSEEGQISASTLGNGNGGNIEITAPQTINLEGNGIVKVEASGTGNAGDIVIDTQKLNVKNGVTISASTIGSGDAGSVELNASEITFVNSEVDAFTNGQGNAGSILFSDKRKNNQNITLKNSIISTEIGERAQANQPSNITLQTNNLNLEQSTITASTAGKGDAGNITISDAQQIKVTESNIIATTSGEGNTGEINLTARENINIANNSEISSSVEIGGVGNSRSINIVTPQLQLTDISKISASTAGKGDAGQISIPNSQTITISDKSTISTAILPGGIAQNRANILINSNQINFNNQSEITASVAGEGKGGNININTNTPFLLDNQVKITSALDESGIGEGGNITINAPSLILDDQSEINASTAGIGEGGFVKLTIDNQVNLNNQSTIATAVEKTGVGVGGQIEIDAQEVNLNNQSQLRASTLGNGNADSITINANKLNIFTGSKIRTETTDSESKSQAGDITVNLQEQFLIRDNDSGLFANTEPKSLGDGGSIIVNAPITILENNSAIAVSTQGVGKGGEIELNTNELTLNNSNINAQTSGGGDGGNIIINAPLTILENNSAIAVNSQGEGKGGDIEITANTLNLDNSDITAQTLNTNGGNITLNIQQPLTLFLNNGSNITSTAGTAQAGGDGGNIVINSPFIFSIPSNSLNTITANAFEGQGGNIEITTNAIFGNEFLVISASSQLGLDGEVIINDPDVDPSSALVIIDSNFVDVESLIAQSPCTEVSFLEGQGSQFIILGRGGLPAQSTDLLTNSIILTPWLDFSTETSVTLTNKNTNISWQSSEQKSLSPRLCRWHNLLK